MHKQRLIHECPYCDQKWSMMITLSRHIKKDHGDMVEKAPARTVESGERQNDIVPEQTEDVEIKQEPGEIKREPSLGPETGELEWDELDSGDMDDLDEEEEDEEESSSDTSLSGFIVRDAAEKAKAKKHRRVHREYEEDEEAIESDNSGSSGHERTARRMGVWSPEEHQPKEIRSRSRSWGGRRIHQHKQQHSGAKSHRRCHSQRGRSSSDTTSGSESYGERSTSSTSLTSSDSSLSEEESEYMPTSSPEEEEESSYTSTPMTTPSPDKKKSRRDSSSTSSGGESKRRPKASTVSGKPRPLHQESIKKYIRETGAPSKRKRQRSRLRDRESRDQMGQRDQGRKPVRRELASNFKTPERKHTVSDTWTPPKLRSKKKNHGKVLGPVIDLDSPIVTEHEVGAKQAKGRRVGKQKSAKDNGKRKKRGAGLRDIGAMGESLPKLSQASASGTSSNQFWGMGPSTRGRHQQQQQDTPQSSSRHMGEQGGVTGAASARTSGDRSDASDQQQEEGEGPRDDNGDLSASDPANDTPDPESNDPTSDIDDPRNREHLEENENPDRDPIDYWLTPALSNEILFKGGKYRPRETLEQALSRLGILVPSGFLPLNTMIAVIDSETCALKVKQDVPFSTFKVEARHVAVCTSVASDVRGFERSRVFINRTPNGDFLERTVHYLNEISDASYEIARAQDRGLLQHLYNLADIAKREGQLKRSAEIKSVAKRFFKHLRQLLCIGYCSSRFDLPLLGRQGLIYALYKANGNKPPVVISRETSKWLSLSTDKLRFIDISLFLGARTSLRSFLNSMGIPVEDSKSYFPFLRLTTHSDLYSGDIPTMDDYANPMTGVNHLCAEYNRYSKLLATGMDQNGALKAMQLKAPPDTPNQLLAKLRNQCIDNRWQFLYEQLAEYAAGDVVALVTAAQRFRQHFTELTQLNPFDFNTVSALSFAYIMKTIGQEAAEGKAFLSLLERETHEFAERGIHGGFAFVKNRVNFSGYTLINEHRYGKDSEQLKSCFLMDGLSLYASGICLFTPEILGFCCFRKKSNSFRADTVSERGLLALAYMSWLGKVKYGARVRTAVSDLGEKALTLDNAVKCRVDGWVELTGQDDDAVRGIVIQIQGCFWHGCSRHYNADDVNPCNGKTYGELYQSTQRLCEHLEKHPNVERVESIWEHEIREELQKNLSCRAFVHAFVNEMLPNKVFANGATWQQMRDAILAEKVHGLVECDLKVKDMEMYRNFFPPFFSKLSYGLNECDAGQRLYAEQNNILKGGHRQEVLNTTCDGTGIVITCSLFRRYLTKMEIECLDIKAVAQFQSQIGLFERWWQNNINKRQEAKRRGANDVQIAIKSILAHPFGWCMSKLHGRKTTSFVTGQNLLKAFSTDQLVGIYAASPSYAPSRLFEVVKSPSRAYLSLPRHFAVNVLCAAKELLLSFVFDFLNQLDDRKIYCILGDTDSVAVGCSSSSLLDAAKPGEREKVQKLIDHFLIPDDDSDRARYMQTKAGAWKIECVCEHIIAVAPKAYAMLSLQSPMAKFASKGVSETFFSRHLFTLESMFMAMYGEEMGVDIERLSAHNRATIKGIGAVKNDGFFYTFSQDRRAISALNIKFKHCSKKCCGFNREFFDHPELMAQHFPVEHCSFEARLAWQHILNQLAEADPSIKHPVLATLA